MKIIVRAIVVIIMSFICFTKVGAQVNLFNQSDLRDVDIDNYSDNDITAMYKKATEAGLSESQILKLAADKGLPDSEVQKLQSRLEALNLVTRRNNANNGINNGNNSNAQPHDSTKLNSNDTTQTVSVQKIQKDLSIFGSELFTTNSLVFEPNLHIPAPAGYILGPDDELLISVYGFSEKSYDLVVDQQGEIYISNVGPIMLSGLTLEQASEKITSKLASTIYKAINTGRTKVQITLGKIKSIRITVIGQAEKPGTFTVSSLTNVYNILYLCGGPTDMGSYRNIEVIHGNEPKKQVDLYDFLVNGVQKNNTLLHEGEVIRIPYYKNRVEIDGRVKRKGKFEMLESETFGDLLKYCGGFTDDAYRGRVTVIRITDSTKNVVDLPYSQFNSFQPRGSDKYIVTGMSTDFQNRIVVNGSVRIPGEYELTPNISVNDLIEKAGGLKKDAYIKEASIFRYLTNGSPTTLLINLDSVMNYGQKIYLKKDDSIHIHSVFDFMNANSITIEGNVRKPGAIAWRQRITLHDALLTVGGVTEFGDSANIEISRRIHNPAIEEANHTESEIIPINLTSDLSNNIYLEPYDLIIVKPLMGYSKQRTVLLSGEVKIPGRYSLQKSKDRISDLIKRAGGFKASADSNSITIRRNVKSNLTIKEREALFQRILNVDQDSLLEDPRLKDELYNSYNLISINLKTVLSNPESSENLILEEGDILTIDRSSNLVKISGEVYFPTVVAYQPNKNLKYYVEQAGNFTPFARKKGALVISPNGKTQSVKHFLWFKSYPSVTARSEIYIPQKNKNNRSRLSIAEMALIVSALGIIANVVKL